MIYEIAGLRVRFQNKYPYTDEVCKPYLSADQTALEDMAVSVGREKFLCEKANHTGYSDGYIEHICLFRAFSQRLPMQNRFLLHASVVEYQGGGYAFLGRSGAGKSTHTNLWCQYLPSARILNGDKPIVHEQDGEFYAYGTPWQGKENIGYNGKVPLRALCFLEQAQENEISVLPLAESAKRLLLQTLLPTDLQNAEATLRLLDECVKTVPCYLLRCDISKAAVRCAFSVLTGQTFIENTEEENEN